MAAQYVTARQLFRMKRSACCCDCPREAADAPEGEVWVIWNGRRFYCPECARREGIARDQ